MDIDLYQVDAFASQPFEGNPAAVCPLVHWPDDELLLNIAMENNLSETAFFVQQGESYRLRWFTPESEVDLCGHATLATAHVLFEHLGYGEDEMVFDSNSGKLTVRKRGDMLVMNFPANRGSRLDPPDSLMEALGVSSANVFRATDYMIVVEDQSVVEKMDPDFMGLKKVDTRGVIVTAPAADNKVDIVSRFFAPALGINEDPVTGSAHTMLVPYWSEHLNKKSLVARQLSRRGGYLHCTLLGDRVEIAGKALTYLQGKIVV